MLVAVPLIDINRHDNNWEEVRRTHGMWLARKLFLLLHGLSVFLVPGIVYNCSDCCSLLGRTSEG